MERKQIVLLEMQNLINGKKVYWIIRHTNCDERKESRSIYIYVTEVITEQSICVELDLAGV